MTQCRFINTETCEKEEEYRLWMNKNQPSSVYNFTETGFLKTRAPAEVRRLLENAWDQYQVNETIKIQGSALNALPITTTGIQRAQSLIFHALGALPYKHRLPMQSGH